VALHGNEQHDDFQSSSLLVDWKSLFVALFSMSTASSDTPDAPLLDASTLEMLASSTEEEEQNVDNLEEEEESTAVTQSAWVELVTHFGAKREASARPLTREDSDLLFERLDANHDGELNLMEITKGLDNMVYNAIDFLPRGDLRIGARRFWTIADANGDKVLSADEFHAMLVRVIGHQKEAAEENSRRFHCMKLVLFEALSDDPAAGVLPFRTIAKYTRTPPPHWGELVRNASYYDDAVRQMIDIPHDAIEVEPETEHVYDHHAHAIVGDSLLVDSHDHQVADE
jgi:hypothetical protein